MGSITFNWTMKEEKEITENKPKHIQENLLLFQVHHLPVAVLQHYQGFYVTEKNMKK